MFWRPKQMTVFTPFTSLFGGMLIGLAAVLLMLTNGRIAGISGIVSRMFPPNTGEANVREGVIFIFGLILAIPLYEIFTGNTPEPVVTSNMPLLIIAGLLVGFGSVWGSGCTSGHGVCGISRLSKRSIIATCTFMFAGFVTVFILRHIVGA